MRRARNEILVELRSRPALIGALTDLGLSRKASAAIADAYPDGRGLENASPRALEQMGATAAQARRVAAAFSMVRVCDANCQARVEGQPINRPAKVVEMLDRAIGRKDQEYFAVILLDARQRVLDVLGTSVGTLSQVDVHPRDVFRDAVRRNAHSIILAHNHPSGSPDPSEADVALTQRIKELGELHGIPVLDHIIVSPGGATSLASIGLL